ncbi:MAG TPA: hypothetical protein VGB63_16080 [Pedobacter sp.]|jgi:hypothetical protein
MKPRTLIAAVVISLSFFACKKERIVFNEIHGKWFQERLQDDNSGFREEYNFQKDGKMEIIRSRVDKSTNIVTGYYSRASGTFSIKSDSVILKDMKSYSSGGNGPKPLNELTYSSTFPRMAYQAVYSEDKAQVTLYFYCPPFANCIPYPKLTRVR